jgi:TPR repeat protein
MQLNIFQSLCAGAWYEYGKHGLSKDLAKAKTYYEAAHKAGNADAKAALERVGKCACADFDGSDRLIAFHMRAADLVGAALKGDREAQWKVACTYYDGTGGVPKDLAQALHFARLSAEAGHVKAQAHVGYMYALGEGGAADSKLAVEWTQKAAAQGNGQANYNLGTAPLSSR